MKVFLSWSGARSKEAALLFRRWLPKVIQAVEPWMSDVDIEKGAQWFAEISREVSASAFGVVFLTRENLEKTWLHFEAGALAKALEGDRNSGRVAAYLLGIEPSDVQGPLKEFQHTKAVEEDTLKLLGSINAQLAVKGEKALKDEDLREIFAMAWPSLRDELKKIIQANEKDKPRRDLRDMVEEILEYVRPRAQPREQIALRAAVLEARLKAAMDQQKASRQRLLGVERAMSMAESKRARLVSDIQAADGADKKDDALAAQMQLAAIESEIPKISDALDLARKELIQNEAAIITARSELDEARLYSNLIIAI
jgi:hypothetical protein